MISQQQIPEIDDANKYNEEPNEMEETLQDLRVHCCVPWRAAQRKSFCNNIQGIDWNICTANKTPLGIKTSILLWRCPPGVLSARGGLSESQKFL